MSPGVLTVISSFYPYLIWLAGALPPRPAPPYYHALLEKASPVEVKDCWVLLRNSAQTVPSSRVFLCVLLSYLLIARHCIETVTSERVLTSSALQHEKHARRLVIFLRRNFAQSSKETEEEAR